MQVCSRCEKFEIAAFSKKARSKRMPKMVIVRVPLESQFEPEIVKERGSIDGAMEWVVTFVRDKHQLSTHGRTGMRMVRRRGGIVGTELRSPARRRPPRIYAYCALDDISDSLSTILPPYIPSELRAFLEPWVTISQ